ncbi:MAG: hypothetical protein M1816_000686 [Peltula sp. TS41687]|nr:MAG: hypothetical protein M1816_000686 [Peltula sp. TS41687]
MPKAITIEKQDSGPGQEVYYPLKVNEVSQQPPKQNELLVRMNAAALNHRDIWIRKHRYPAVGFNVPLLADGVGTVMSTGSSELDTRWKGQRVILTPGRGWDSSPEGPEDAQYFIIGGTKLSALGTLQEYVTVKADEVEEAPAHLSDAEAAALPLAGLTAWRAVFTKSRNAKPGHNILVTGIGGGVALNAFQFASAAGCNVFVTSGSEEKLKRAKDMGAQGGVNYRDEQWEKKLLELLPQDRRFLDAVIDGAGGDIVERTSRVLLKVNGASKRVNGH